MWWPSRECASRMATLGRGKGRRDGSGARQAVCHHPKCSAEVGLVPLLSLPRALCVCLGIF